MTALSPRIPRRRHMARLRWAIPLIAGVTIVSLAVLIHHTSSTRAALLFLTGAVWGLVLYPGGFGSTRAFGLLLTARRSAGLRAQIVVLGVVCVPFFPALAAGSLIGQPISGFVSPAGTSVAVGAFLFGVGMQLCGGSAAGTLLSMGGGHTRAALTLVFFIMGSVVGVTHLAWWQTMPALPPISLISTFGWPLALGLNTAVFAAVYGLAARVERRRHGTVEPIAALTQPSAQRGPWPLLAGALGLALLNLVTLCLAGHPWGITSAFGLWGGIALQHLGMDVQAWSGFSNSGMRTAMAGGVLSDVTSVMNIGIVIGAMLCAGLARQFKPPWRISGRHAMASVVGGFLLGYGARLAYGCNIGAFFGGIASGSLHGWLWIAFALLGNGFALYARPAFDPFFRRQHRPLEA